MKHVWIVMSYDDGGSEILEVFESEASALAFAEGYKTKYGDEWGEAVLSDDGSSRFWADGGAGTLAVVRHEVRS